MKKHLLIAFAALVIAGCSDPGERIVERPEAALRNNSIVEIDRVIANDTATILYLDAFADPSQWIGISSDTYIQAGGRKLGVTGVEGIEFDSRISTPDNGPASFVLYFPALPKGTKSFDFIESDCEDCFKIWGIDLTGNFKPQTSLPKEFGAPAGGDSAPLPEPELKTAQTTLTVKLYGTREGFEPEPVLSVGNFLKGEYETVPTEENTGGTYSYRFETYGTSPATLKVGSVTLNFLLAPGDDAQIHYDALAQSTGSSRYSTLTQPTFAGFKGTFAAVNNEMNAPGKVYNADPYQLIFDPTAWTVDNADYPAKVAQLRQAKLQELDDMDISDNLRKIYTGDVNSQAMFNILNKDMVRFNSQYFATGAAPQRQAPEPFTDAVLLDAAKELDPDNTSWLYSRNFPAIARIFATKEMPEASIDHITGGSQGLVRDLRLSYPAVSKAETDEGATQDELADLERSSSPFYGEAYRAMHERAILAKRKAMEAGGFEIVDVPDVAEDKILEAIIAAHRGKAVFVDFWATWCGPCLNAMKQIKPLKAQMQDQGVVTIYISNVSSPRNKWLTMLPDIGGIHYYLDESQWRTLCNKYDIQGIPQYMIFDKEGNKTFQTAGFPGVDAMRGELEKVW
ncbi:MAG: TlpA family protein disulfide reductase [Alistipes sp.]|nr:TlpA family protein disulfide reductase [Alistipes sp.]